MRRRVFIAGVGGSPAPIFAKRPYSVKVNASSCYIAVVIVADRTEILRDRCVKICKIVRVEHDGLGIHFRLSNAKGMMKPEIFAQPLLLCL
jgi:hypothetical protein